MRILYVTDAFAPETGGVERVCLETARSHVRAGHDVTVLSKATGGAPADETIDGIRVRRYPYSRAWTPVSYLTTIRSSARIAARLHAQRPFDVLHSHLTLSSVGPIRRLSRRGVRVVCTFYGPWHREFAVESQALRDRPWPYPRYLDLLERSQKRMQAGNLRRADGRICLSRYSIGRARSIAPDLPADSFAVVPGGIDPERFRPIADGESKADLRTRLHLPDGFLVLCVRRLVKRMGLPNLIHAAHMLREGGRPLHLVIGGSGPEKHALARLIGRLGLETSVTLVGYIPDDVLPDFYRAADLFVLPTAQEENFGLIILEAAACGCPVAATPVGSIPEVLGDLSDAFVCDGTGPAEIAAKIQWVRDERDKVNWKFAREIAPRVRQTYAWDRIAERLRAIYRNEPDCGEGA